MLCLLFMTEEPVPGPLSTAKVRKGSLSAGATTLLSCHAINNHGTIRRLATNAGSRPTSQWKNAGMSSCPLSSTVTRPSSVGGTESQCTDSAPSDQCCAQCLHPQHNSDGSLEMLKRCAA